MSLNLNFELARVETLVLSSRFNSNVSNSKPVANRGDKIQPLSVLTDFVKDVCDRVHDFIMKVIRSIKDCFIITQSESTFNTANTRSPLNLISFYRGQEANNNGVTIDQILGWDNEQLESAHNYIQWLFPLKEPTRFNDTAPILNSATIQVFQGDQALKHQLLRSFRRMLSFYGLQMNEATKVISRAPTFNARSAEWLINPLGHHNFLRITRIIRSLNLLGHSDYSQSFLNIVQDIHRNEGNGIISASTFQFWRDAALAS